MSEHHHDAEQSPNAHAIRQYLEYIQAVEGDLVREVLSINQDVVRACSAEIKEALILAAKASHAHSARERMDIQRRWNVSAAARAAKYSESYFDHLTSFADLMTKLIDPAAAKKDEQLEKPSFV